MSFCLCSSKAPEASPARGARRSFATARRPLDLPRSVHLSPERACVKCAASACLTAAVRLGASHLVASCILALRASYLALTRAPPRVALLAWLRPRIASPCHAMLPHYRRDESRIVFCGPLTAVLLSRISLSLSTGPVPYRLLRASLRSRSFLSVPWSMWFSCSSLLSWPFPMCGSSLPRVVSYLQARQRLLWASPVEYLSDRSTLSFGSHLVR